MVQQGPTPGKKARKRSSSAATKGMARSQSLPDHLAVEEAGSDEVGQVAVEPLHAVEQRARVLAGLELGQHLLDDVVTERRVDR